MATFTFARQTDEHTRRLLTRPFRRGARARLRARAARKTISGSSCRSAIRRGRPVLEIALFSGDIDVEAYDGNEIIIVADAPMRDADGEEEPRADGLRRIQSSSVGLTVEESDNTVSVRMDFSPKNVGPRGSRAAPHVRAREPRQRRRRRDHGRHGRARAVERQRRRRRHGHLGLGRHQLRRTATCARRSPPSTATKPMSFTSFNGDVDVTLPANLAADLIVASQQGDVYTDFDVQRAATIRRASQRSGDAGGR